jgi:hypothetical protein
MVGENPSRTADGALGFPPPGSISENRKRDALKGEKAYYFLYSEIAS